MKRLLKLLLSRIGMVSLGILLQLFVLLASLLWFKDYKPVITTLSTILSWLLILYVLSLPENPAYKMAWIIPILGFPVLGLSLYLLFGGSRLSKRLRRKMGDIDKTLEETMVQNETVMEALRQDDPGAAVQARSIRTRRRITMILASAFSPRFLQAWSGLKKPSIWNTSS